MTEESKNVYLVVMATGGMFGIYEEYGRAVEAATHILGTVIILPIHRDFRKPGVDIQHGPGPNKWKEAT